MIGLLDLDNVEEDIFSRIDDELGFTEGEERCRSIYIYTDRLYNYYTCSCAVQFISDHLHLSGSSSDEEEAGVGPSSNAVDDRTMYVCRLVITQIPPVTISIPIIMLWHHTIVIAFIL